MAAEPRNCPIAHKRRARSSEGSPWPTQVDDPLQCARIGCPPRTYSTLQPPGWMTRTTLGGRDLLPPVGIACRFRAVVRDEINSDPGRRQRALPDGREVAALHRRQLVRLRVTPSSREMPRVSVSACPRRLPVECW